MSGDYPPLKLSYFRVRGRAELTRLIFAAGQVPFEDERVSRQEQQRRKSSGELPFGQFPTLSVDGRVFAQSYSIAKYAAKLAGLLSSDHLAALEAEGVVDMTEDVRSKFVPIRYLPVPPEAKLAKYEEFFTTTLPPWLQRYEEILAVRSTSGFLAGDSLSIADIAAFNMCDFLTNPSCEVQASSEKHKAMGANCLQAFPKLQENRCLASGKTNDAPRQCCDSDRCRL